MKINYHHPRIIVSYVAEWDKKGEVLLLDFENHDEAANPYPRVLLKIFLNGIYTDKRLTKTKL